MDVTYYKTIDNIQYYIYTIVDNFSRKIIAYDVSKKPYSVSLLFMFSQSIFKSLMTCSFAITQTKPEKSPFKLKTQHIYPIFDKSIFNISFSFEAKQIYNLK
jgi:hypothetical protein